MPRACWQIQHGRPVIEVTFYPPGHGQEVSRVLLADTGGGTLYSAWDLILTEGDCQLLNHGDVSPITLSGAFAGTFSTFYVHAAIPALGTSHTLVAVAVPAGRFSLGIDGIAGFRFLNTFHYGNFGDGTQFCLETV